MTTIYGFKRPDGSVVVDTRDSKEAAENAMLLYQRLTLRAEPNPCELAAFTLSPDGTITPRKE